MSHAANLRARQEAATAPSKRRKLAQAASSSQANGVDGLVNGFASKKLQAAPTRDVKDLKRKKQHESEVALSALQEDAEMMDAESASASDAEEEQPQDIRGDDNASDNEIADAETAAGQDEELSFGDMLRARNETTFVDLPGDSVFQADNAHLNTRALTAPPANSLTTVLTQALRTNDLDLLESCLQIQNLDSIRATIERLNPQHASTLLQKLAERMHKRPGRAGSLMVWMQWTIVAFGGYLASQPAAMKQLQTLYSVVKQRATGLQPLLALKGKLDMLEAQMQLRRNISSRQTNDEDDGPVIYVEDEEDAAGTRHKRLGQKSVLDVKFDDSEDDDDAGFPNGIGDLDVDDEDEDEEDDDDSDENLLDDEAEVTDDDEGEDDDELDFDDNDDEVSDDEADIVETRASKRPRSKK